MPKLDDSDYAAQNTKTLELAARQNGVTVKEIQALVINKMTGKGVSRPRAEALVKLNNLVLVDKKGRTLVYGAPGSAPFVATAKEKAPSKRTVSVEARASQLLKKLDKLTSDVEALVVELRAKNGESIDDVMTETPTESVASN